GNHPLYSLLPDQISTFSKGNEEVAAFLWPKNKNGSPVTSQDGANSVLEPALLLKQLEKSGASSAPAQGFSDLDALLFENPTTPDSLRDHPVFAAWQTFYQERYASAATLSPAER